MSYSDCLIVILPFLFVIGMAVYSRCYIRDVVDYLSAGRVCGRYLIAVAGLESALGIITLVAYVEANYKAGFAYGFWGAIVIPFAMLLSLTGFFVYRFRETKAMTIGQFLEMRYSRRFRIFAAFLRTFSEMMTNTIGPAVAARFFIYLFGWPNALDLWGMRIPTFAFVTAMTLVFAMIVIWSGGMISLVVTDSIQGIMSYPIFLIFTVYILLHFSWFGEIVPTLSNRVPGESFLNPFDVKELRDFNVFAVIVMLFGTFLNRGVWCGGGTDTAARTAHESKMAGILGTWRNGFSYTMQVLLAVALITMMNNADFSREARKIRISLTHQILGEKKMDLTLRKKLTAAVERIPEQKRGTEAPLSIKDNIDSKYFDTVQKILVEEKGNAQGNALTLEFRSLFNQMMLPVALRHMLPGPLLAMFCLLALLLMLSTDDSRIFSSARTLAQDVIMPLIRRPLTTRQQLWLIRWLTLFVCICFFCGSLFLSQLDYINLYVTIMAAIWIGGAGAVTMGGIYTRFGTTSGAYASLFTGALIAGGGVIVQRNWPDHVFPFLDRMGWVPTMDWLLRGISSPFVPYIRWEMDPVKCPINSQELFFIAMLMSILAYCLGSLITYRRPFNLEKMLHRGEYNDEKKVPIETRWTIQNFVGKIIGITSEYTKGDKIIAWSVFGYSFIYGFLLCFVGVVAWNLFDPWTIRGWGVNFFITALLVPCIVGVVSTVWFFTGGILDLRRLFRDLAKRPRNPLDNGRVEEITVSPHKTDSLEEDKKS